MPPAINREVWKLVESLSKLGVVYDSRAIAFSPTKLVMDEGASSTFNVILPEDDGTVGSKSRKFTVIISFAREVELSRLAAFVRGGQRTGATPDMADISSASQALNVVIQHAPMMQYPSKSGSFYPPPHSAEEKQRAQILRGLEIWSAINPFLSFSSLR